MQASRPNSDIQTDTDEAAHARDRPPRERALSAALLLIAAASVLLIRLLPLQLPAITDLARQAVRQRIDARLGVHSSAAAVRGGPTDEWIAAHPDQFAQEVTAETARLDAAFRYEDATGQRRAFLGDYDSYTWLRAARNYLRSGTVCDAVVDGQCRDDFTLAPVGAPMLYGRALHTAAIVGVHRIARWFIPAYPLAASAYLVPVIVGVFGVVPAFAIGRRLAGPVAGFFAALVSGLQPTFLRRSIGSDNDVWNVVLPLVVVWALVAAVQAKRRTAQIGAAVLAGGLTGVLASAWRGWTFTAAVVLVGLMAALLLNAAHWLWRRRDRRFGHAHRMRTIVAVALAYGIVTAAVTRWAASETLDVAATDSAVDGQPRLRWPAALDVVGELRLPTLPVIAERSHGYAVLFAGYLGMLLLLLPRGRWRDVHFAVLLVGTSCYLFAAPDLSRLTLATVLGLPPAAAAAITVGRGDEHDVEAAGTGMVIAVWLVAALLMSYQALRYVILLAAPLGVCVGITMGRLHALLLSSAQRGGRSQTAARALAVAVVLIAAVIPLRSGYQIAAAYVPAIDRAWADSLQRLGTDSPPDAIVNTWWDYGYWTKYVASRRVSADGSTLLTHVPHWLARAQLATTEPEAAGLLRMLNCGSDAQPLVEGARGAMSKLMHAGLSELSAYNAVVQVAQLDRAAADGHLASLGLDAAARTDVLDSTHCAPPPAYLVVSSQQADLPGWWQLGTWDPNHAGTRVRSSAVGFFTIDWVPCELTSAGQRRCVIAGSSLARAGKIDAIIYDPDDARSTRMVATRPIGGQVEVAPDLLLVTDGSDLETIGQAKPGQGGTAVLLDRAQHRVLVGVPSAIASMYTRLAFLGGVGATRFHKTDERTGAWGQRVLTFAVEW